MVKGPLDRHTRQLSRAQQIAQLGSWEWEVPSGHMLWSDEMYRVLGLEPGAIDPTIQAFLQTIHPEDRAAVEGRLSDALHALGCFELEFRTADDSLPSRSIHCRAEVFLDNNDQPVRILGTAYDVTEVRHTSRQLRNQVEQLQQLAQASVAIYAADGLEETLEAATRHALGIAGAMHASGSIALPGSAGNVVVHLSDDGPLEAAAGRLLAAVEPLDRPIRLARGASDRHPALRGLDESDRALVRGGWMVVPLSGIFGGASGAIQLFGKPSADFTENDESLVVQIAQVISLALQKSRLFEDLQLSEERYRRLFDAHLSGDFILSAEGIILDANLTLARLLGFPSIDALKGLDVREVYSAPEDLGLIGVRIRERRRAFQQETQLTRADGSKMFAIVNLVGVFDRQGEMVELQGCLLDITEWKAAEAALRESQQQLLQSQKMEAVGQLAGGIAHDFNSMLTAIQGFADLLEEQIGYSSGARSHLDEIRKAADRSARLTRQLLAYSRRQVLQPEVIELNGVVSGMGDMLRRLIGGHIEYVSVLDPTTARVHADPGQLQQVLMNLVLNARDAMEKGGRLVVRTSMETVDERTDMGDFFLPSNDYAVLTVTDNGRGIPEEILPRIFEPFFTTKAVGEGSGLGLSTVFGIVKQSGGYIRAASTANEETTFTIFLPCTNSAADSAATASSDRKVGGIDGKGRVLVAEDESILRTLAATVLRRNGFDVIEAEDGFDALQKAAAIDFDVDVLVTDVVMPRVGGEQLATSLLESRPHLPIVFMSGYAEEIIARQGALTSNSVFLEKPFSPNVLARAVLTLCGVE